MTAYNYETFPLDLDGKDFQNFSSLISAGDRAPDGTLTDAHTGESVTLSGLWKKTHVVIEFGSYT